MTADPIVPPADAADPVPCLADRVLATVEDVSDDDVPRIVTDMLRQHLAVDQAEARADLLTGTHGARAGRVCVERIAATADDIMVTLYRVALERLYPVHNPTKSERLCIVAQGGYGRGELAPASDLDLLFLMPYKQNPVIEQVVEFMLYRLWDLGFKVGHAVRSVDDCIKQAKQDLTIRTSLLETRYLIGEQALFDRLKTRFTKDVVAGSGVDFTQAKLAERDSRHQRWGDSRYVLEPNVKEGKGGLRDLHTLFWIVKYLYEVDDLDALVERGILQADEQTKFVKAYDFLTIVRCHLHYLTGRADERLTFDVQTEIGSRLGYVDHAGTLGVERFMKHYFLIAKDVGDLTRIFCAAFEADSLKPPRFSLSRLRFKFGKQRTMDDFILDGERLNISNDRHFQDNPVDMIRLFRVAQEHDLRIHPNALRAITRSLKKIGPKVREDPRANGIFMDIITAPQDPERALRRMNEAGVLGRFVPDFGRVVCQMQYDMYHVYTVDEHTLMTLGILHRIEAGELAEESPIATDVMRGVISRRALYLALFFHDIAKGRGGDHSVIGARIARKLGPRLGLDAEETETVAWLVRWHLAMSSTALKRDLDDEKTIRDFVALVQSPEWLRLLLVLTVVDIRAVGPGRWNGWKAGLLRELFYRAEDVMSGGMITEGREKRIAAVRQSVRSILDDFTDHEFDTLAGRAPTSYWLSFHPDQLAQQARLIRDAERSGQPLMVDTRTDRRRQITEVMVYTVDHPGLSWRLAGALSLAGLNIVDAKLFTMTNGMALDVFTVQNAGNEQQMGQDKVARLAAQIELAVSGQTDPLKELSRREPAFPSRTRAIPVTSRVLIDNKVSRSHTVIEINGRDRPGLLAEISKTLTDIGLQISSAKISTFGTRAVDVFYVKDIFGLQVTHNGKRAEAKRRLKAILAREQEDARESPAATTPGAAKITSRAAE